ncbi:MAG TPA: hypothetical protein V6D08_09400 [Candidatus Obscuribacterales bacterium]
MKAASRKVRNSGNILILTCVLTWLVALGVAVGMSLTSLYVTHVSAQSMANEVAMAAAQVLNNNDREGQMNNMISRNRQLVFASREVADWTTPDYPALQPLAERLLREARDSARTLESERSRLRELTQEEAKQKAQEALKQLQSKTRITLPWIQTSAAELADFRLGYANRVETNVLVPPGLPQLAEFDRKKEYAQERSNLYRANVNAKLLGADADLDYHLASLAAPVKNSVSPARLIVSRDFRELPSAQLPSAAKVDLVITVATKVGVKAEKKLRVTGSASASGALEDRAIQEQ